MTEAKIARFTKEGRGTGDGVNYRPWLTVHDLSSLGRTARMLGRRNRRIHHLFSDIERSAFLEYDWRDDVVDIREQFPLDREGTRLVAAERGLRHPRDPGSRVDVVMTTDLLVTFRDGARRAVQCKSISDLRKPRTLEKLEIERRYGSLMGVEWKLWTQASTTKVRIQNLAFLHEYLNADDHRLVSDGHWEARAALFLAMLRRVDAHMPFVAFASEFEARGCFSAGDAIATMRFLACRKLIAYDLDVEFKPQAPIGCSIYPIRSSPKSEAA